MDGLKITRRRIIAAIGTGVLALGVTGAALAAPTPPAGGATGHIPLAGAHCAGVDGGMPMLDNHQAVADLLGLTPTELMTQLHGGKSLAAIAGEKGVSTDKLIETMLATAKTHLATQVSIGTLTQAQADQMWEQMKTGITTMIQSPMGPGVMGPDHGPGMMGGGFGPGMMGTGGAGFGPGQMGPGSGHGPGGMMGRGFTPGQPSGNFLGPRGMMSRWGRGAATPTPTASQ